MVHAETGGRPSPESSGAALLEPKSTSGTAAGGSRARHSETCQLTGRTRVKGKTSRETGAASRAEDRCLSPSFEGPPESRTDLRNPGRRPPATPAQDRCPEAAPARPPTPGPHRARWPPAPPSRLGATSGPETSGGRVLPTVFSDRSQPPGRTRPPRSGPRAPRNRPGQLTERSGFPSPRAPRRREGQPPKGTAERGVRQGCPSEHATPSSAGPAIESLRSK